jgi:hypothetical protein
LVIVRVSFLLQIDFPNILTHLKRNRLVHLLVAGGRRRRRVCILISAHVTLVCFITSRHVKKQTQLEAMQLKSGAARLSSFSSAEKSTSTYTFDQKKIHCI